jgi:hypothetical protein
MVPVHHFIEKMVCWRAVDERLGAGTESGSEPLRDFFMSYRLPVSPANDCEENEYHICGQGSVKNTNTHRVLHQDHPEYHRGRRLLPGR